VGKARTVTIKTTRIRIRKYMGSGRVI